MSTQATARPNLAKLLQRLATTAPVTAAVDLKDFTPAEKLAALLVPSVGTEKAIVEFLRSVKDASVLKDAVVSYVSLMVNSITFDNLDVERVKLISGRSKAELESSVRSEIIDVRLMTPLNYHTIMDNTPSIKSGGASVKGVSYDVFSSRRVISMADPRAAYVSCVEVINQTKATMPKVLFKVYPWNPKRMLVARAMLAHYSFDWSSGFAKIKAKNISLPPSIEGSIVGELYELRLAWVASLERIREKIAGYKAIGTDLTDNIGNVYAAIDDIWNTVNQNDLEVVAAILDVETGNEVYHAIIDKALRERTVKSIVQGDAFATEVNRAGEQMTEFFNKDKVVMKMAECYAMEANVTDLAPSRTGAIAAIEVMVQTMDNIVDKEFSCQNVVLVGTGSNRLSDAWGQAELVDSRFQAVVNGMRAPSARFVFAPGKSGTVMKATTIFKEQTKDGLPDLTEYLKTDRYNVLIVNNLVTGDEDSQKKLYDKIIPITFGYKGVFCFAFNMSGGEKLMEIIASLYEQKFSPLTFRHPRLMANQIFLVWGSAVRPADVDLQESCLRAMMIRTRIRDEVLFNKRIIHESLFWGLRPINKRVPSEALNLAVSAVYTSAKLLTEVVKAARGIKMSETGNSLREKFAATMQFDQKQSETLHNLIEEPFPTDNNSAEAEEIADRAMLTDEVPTLPMNEASKRRAAEELKTVAPRTGPETRSSSKSTQEESPLRKQRKQN